MQTAEVLLVHGLTGKAKDMEPLARYLSGRGYSTTVFSYPSTRITVEQAADRLAKKVKRLAEGGRVHLVAHSLGTLLIRMVARDHGAGLFARVVLLAPPSRGTPLVEPFLDRWWFSKVYGPAGKSLSTRETGVAADLGPVPFPCAVIAGTKSLTRIIHEA
ncbi:MAG: alpha/beta fold hydrolase [Deltaproteobacteria bacterium]|nr:alpha/beta fold hydrolase [Deltaproteobacteria bacterium]